jgi:dolichol kinase
MIVVPEFLYYSSLLFMSLVYIYPLYFFAVQTLTELKNHNHRTAANNIICISLVFFLCYNTLYLLITARAINDNYFFIWFFSVVPIAILWILFIVSTIWFRRKNKIPNISELKRKYAEINQSDMLMEDMKRKGAHVAFFIILWLVIFIAIPIGILVEPSLLGDQFKIWEFNGNISSDLFLYYNFLINPSTINQFGFIHLILIVGFIFSAYGFIMFETIRHSKVFYFPTTSWFTRYLKTEEHEHIASYCYFFLAAPFAAFILPPLYSIAILGVTTIGDLLASQIGMRFGRSKIRINPHKSKAGRLAGTLGSLVITTIFIGPFFGIAAAFIFYLTDTLTETPIHVSDNLANPTLITLLFMFMNILGVPGWIPVLL